MANWKIDLNADVAEGCGQDEALMSIISSANICCGLHAGSSTEILKTLRLAKKHNVRVGAHPGYDDRENFGRINQQLPEDELRALIRYQLAATQALCDYVDIEMSYVKPHGALYNQAANDEKIALILIEEIKNFNENLSLMALSGSLFIQLAEQYGLRTESEVFADRRYTDQATLVPRSQENAMLEDENEAIQQVLQMIRESSVTSENGNKVAVKADSICLHGDNEHAVKFAQKIQNILIEQNVQISAYCE